MISTSKTFEYCPFWIFEIQAGQNKNLIIQDAVKLLPSEIGLFKVKDKSKPFLFYIPAFKIKNLNKIPDISFAFTRTQPELEKVKDIKGKLKGVFTTEEDAKKLVELLWLDLISSKTNLDLNTWKNIKCENGKILWLPFYQDGIFIRDAVIEYGLQRTM